MYARARGGVGGGGWMGFVGWVSGVGTCFTSREVMVEADRSDTTRDKQEKNKKRPLHQQ